MSNLIVYVSCSYVCSSDEEADGDSDDGNYHYSNKANEAELFAKKKAANPLPGFRDPITAEEVEDPYISPYGHVMGKTTWSRCLQQEPKNTCPFTKQPIRKRDLVALTWENIDQYEPSTFYVIVWAGSAHHDGWIAYGAAGIRKRSRLSTELPYVFTFPRI